MIPVANANHSRGRTNTPAGALPPQTNLRAVLIAVVVVLLCGFVLLTQVAVVVPWKPSQIADKLTAAPKFLQGLGNQSDSHATYQQAKGLQQDHQQLHQAHQQQQQGLQDLKQQHDQQTQALSSLQQTQQQIQAGVQTLEHLYGQLSNSSALAASQLNAGQQSRSAAAGFQQEEQQQVGKATEQGVVCTVLRNEARYIPEWVAFHILMGATKMVIYDDNSTDGLREAAAPFGDRVVIVDMQKDVQGVPGDASVHRVNNRQNWAFNHCKSTHAPANGTGWFGIWDVDEFVYPCMRPGRQLQGRNLIWEAYNASTKAGADGHALHCSLFGQNHNDTAQGNDTLVLVNNIRRAPDSRSEPAAAPKAWEAVAEGCNKCGCCQVTSRKTIYNVKTAAKIVVSRSSTHCTPGFPAALLSQVGKMNLGTHGPFNEAVIDNSWQKPLSGLCCNHYQFKSTAEAFAKAPANLNDHYTKVANTSDAKKHLTMLQDTLVWQYLPDMVQLLQQKGFHYKTPEVPVLVVRDRH